MQAGLCFAVPFATLFSLMPEHWKMVEALTAGHPDKICDQIADALLDEFLRRDPATRATIEVFASHGMLAVGGSVVSRADFDTSVIAKNIHKEITGHDDVEVFVNMGLEVPTSATLMSSGSTVVNGYATRETREFLPRPYVLAQALAKRLDDLRATDPAFFWLRPHGKVQVLCQGKQLVAITLLLEHADDVPGSLVRETMRREVLEPVVGDLSRVALHVNPYGRYRGGECVHASGSTGCKIANDTYGGLVPHGLSSISGKDPYSPNRAGAYAARQAAKSLVASGQTPSALVSVGYTLGQAAPVFVQALGANGADFSDVVKKHFDFRPEAIVERLHLACPMYRGLSCYGHFGRLGMPWEDVVGFSADVQK